MKTGVVKVRVIYADTDAMGIVYHSNHIKWFEVGRTEMLREVGIVYRELESEGFYLPVTELYCHYLKPARYDVVLSVETRIHYFRRASLRFDYEIWDEPRENCLVEGYTIHAFLNREGRIVRPPDEIAQQLRALVTAPAPS